MLKQSYITKSFSIFLYLLSLCVQRELEATNFKIKDESVRGSHELGKLKVLHHDKKGYTIFADGKKHKLESHQVSSELRSLNNKQLSALTKAAYISVHKQSDGELALKSHVRGNGGWGWTAEAVGEGLGNAGAWVFRFVAYGSMAWAAKKLVSDSKKPVTMSDGTRVAGAPSEHPLNVAIDSGGNLGMIAGVTKYGSLTVVSLPVGNLALQAQQAKPEVMAYIGENLVKDTLKLGELINANAANIAAGSTLGRSVGSNIQGVETGARFLCANYAPQTYTTLRNAVGVRGIKYFPEAFGGGIFAAGMTGLAGKDCTENFKSFTKKWGKKTHGFVDKHATDIGIGMIGAGAVLGTGIATGTAAGAGMTASEVIVANSAAGSSSVATFAKDLVVPAASKVHWAVECGAGAVKYSIKAACHFFIPA